MSTIWTVCLFVTLLSVAGILWQPNEFNVVDWVVLVFVFIGGIVVVRSRSKSAIDNRSREASARYIGGLAKWAKRAIGMLVSGAVVGYSLNLMGISALSEILFIKIGLLIFCLVLVVEIDRIRVVFGGKPRA